MGEPSVPPFFLRYLSQIAVDIDKLYGIGLLPPISGPYSR